MDLDKAVSGFVRQRFVRQAGVLALLSALVSGCSDEGVEAINPVADDNSAPTTPVSGAIGRLIPDLTVPANLFQLDGYDTVNVQRVDIRTRTTAGICVLGDESGCTLADVNADINAEDEFKVDIPIHFKAADYADDGSTSNAELRQRGGSSRLYPQKSYRIKLDKDVMFWRNERRLQLNKHPADLSRLRNKLSFDLMHTVPNLPSLRTQFVNLWVDDGQGAVDYGLFTHVEASTKEFLSNRNWNGDGHLYKADPLAFSADDLSVMQLDATGAPLDPDAFEQRLSIEAGPDDHTQLLKMLTAVNDPAQSFDGVLNRYFDRDNVLAWLAVNFLLAQKDVTTHNFFLYNPANSEKFYFLPWDYDAAFYVEVEPENNFSNEALGQRLFYGYARGANSNFLSQFFRLPGINAAIVAKANQLRSTVLSDAAISARVNQYADVIRPYVTRMPDAQNLASGNDALASFNSQIQQLTGYVSTNHQTLQAGLGIPMPPTLKQPERVGDQLVFSWSPAYDVLGNSIIYDLQVSTEISFGISTIVHEMTGIADSANDVLHSVAASSLPASTLYYRVIARPSSDPQRLWQVSNNTLMIDGTLWFGALRFDTTTTNP